MEERNIKLIYRENFDNSLSEKKKLNILAVIIIVELVLGGSGRLIAFGTFLSLRYLLFFIAILYYIFFVFRNNLNIRRNIFFKPIIIFLIFYFFSISNGLIKGYEIGDVIKSSQGFLYIFMILPFTIFIDNKEKANQAIKIFINSTIILGIIALLIYVLFSISPGNYSIITKWLDKFNYGYISIRNGLPAVFLKGTPYLVIAFNIELFRYINMTERSYKSIINMSILFLAILATISMGAWIALFVGIILCIFLSNGKKNILIIFAIVIAGILIYYIFSDYIGKIIELRISSNDSSYIIKSNQLHVLIKTWLNNFLFGNGFGVKVNFMTQLGYREMINFELFWLQLLVNMGLCGFLAYLNIIVKNIIESKRNISFLDEFEKINLKACNIGLITLCIISSVNPFLNNPIGIGYVVILMCIINAYRRDIKQNLEK